MEKKGEAHWTIQQVIERALSKGRTQELKQTMLKANQAMLELQRTLEPMHLQLGSGAFSTGPDQGPYFEISASQKLPIGPRYSELRDTHDLRMKLAEMNATQTLISFHGLVLESILQYQMALLRKNHVEEREQRIKLLHQFLKARKAVTPASRLDRVLIESRVREVEIEIQEVKLLYQNGKSRLASLADLPNDFELERESLPFSTWENLVLGELESRRTIKSRRELENRIMESRANAARWSWVPDLGVYFLQNEQSPSALEKTQILGLQLIFPFWGRGAKVAEVESASRILQIERIQRDSELDAMANELRMRIGVVRAFERSNSSEVLSRMEKSLAEGTKAFQLGQVTATSLLELEDHAHYIHERGLRLRAELFSYLIHLAPQLNVSLDYKGARP